MRRYLVRRAGLGLLMLWAVSMAVFFFTQALPGDVARQILGQSATPAQIKALHSQLGLDQPLWVQYVDWIRGLLSGDLGTSLTSGQNVAQMLLPRIANSLAIVAVTALVLLPAAFSLGSVAALRPGGLIDRTISAFILVVIGLPQFIIAILLVILFATNVAKVLPPTSIVDSNVPLWDQSNLLVLPVLALVLGSLPYLTESVRGTLRYQLASEHVEWARLCGLPQSTIFWRYAVPNALSPSLQVAGTTLVYLMGGIVAVEVVFAFPGLGAAMTAAVAYRDIPVVQAIAMLLATASLLVYLLADIGGILLTPRVRTTL